MGNVQAVINDKKRAVEEEDIVTYHSGLIFATDYYPFGMTMPERALNTPDYRYGYQGQETDRELWDGCVAYKYRIEDPRLGRFFSTDPLAPDYPWNSPYAFSENRVIDGVELEGLEWQYYVNRSIKESFSDFFESVGNAKQKETEMQKGLNKAIAVPIFQSVFKEELPKKFISHYAFGEGKLYKLNEREMTSLHVAHTGISGITSNDINSFSRLISNVEKGGTVSVDRHIEGASNVGGTLGRFTIHIIGSLHKSVDGNEWDFEGKMQFIDTWDFKTNQVSDGSLQRTSWGDMQTEIGDAFLPGTPFSISSDWVDIKQNSKENKFSWFTGKSETSVQNEVSNEKKLGSD